VSGQNGRWCRSCCGGEEREEKEKKEKKERSKGKAEAAEGKAQVGSLVEMAEDKILVGLSTLLETNTHSATYACDGSVHLRSVVDKTAKETTEKKSAETIVPKASETEPSIV
jgi:hypothetical protein